MPLRPEADGPGGGIHEVVAAVDAIATVDDAGDLARLQDYVLRYFADPRAADYLGVWFRLYERFPVADGYGVFWSVLHGIEVQPGYRPQLVESVRRRPSRFTLRMVNDLLNGGVQSITGVDLLELLGVVAADPQCDPVVREEAQDFLGHQRSRIESAAAAALVP